jgi:hypothetical protein
MRYALLVCGDESVVIGHDDEAAWEAAFTSRLDELRASGVLLSAARLCPTATATTVQVWGGDVVAATGPFAETREQIGSLLIVDCKDLDHAMEIATGIPAAWYGTIEVRPVWETEQATHGPPREEAPCDTPC